MKDIVFKTIMLKGEAGSSITSIEKTGSVGNVDTYTIHFNDDTPDFTFEVTNGYSIISIEKTSTLGNIDTYTVTLDNGETYTFTVTNSNVINSMTAQDETTVAPSINAVKQYVEDEKGDLFFKQTFSETTDSNGLINKVVDISNIGSIGNIHIIGVNAEVDNPTQDLLFFMDFAESDMPSMNNADLTYMIFYDKGGNKTYLHLIFNKLSQPNTQVNFTVFYYLY